MAALVRRPTLIQRSSTKLPSSLTLQSITSTQDPFAESSSEEEQETGDKQCQDAIKRMIGSDVDICPNDVDLNMARKLVHTPKTGE